MACASRGWKTLKPAFTDATRVDLDEPLGRDLVFMFHRPGCADPQVWQHLLLYLREREGLQTGRGLLTDEMIAEEVARGRKHGGIFIPIVDTREARPDAIRCTQGYLSVPARHGIFPTVSHEAIHPSFTEKAPDEWSALTMSLDMTAYTFPETAPWVINRAKRVAEGLEPAFGFADTNASILGHRAHDPHGVAWPVMMWGRELAETIGRSRLLSAPAWRVEEAANGSVWAQVAENAFTVSRRQMKRFADHLDLKIPRWGEPVSPDLQRAGALETYDVCLEAVLCVEATHASRDLQEKALSKVGGYTFADDDDLTELGFDPTEFPVHRIGSPSGEKSGVICMDMKETEAREWFDLRENERGIGIAFSVDRVPPHDVGRACDAFVTHLIRMIDVFRPRLGYADAAGSPRLRPDAVRRERPWIVVTREKPTGTQVVRGMLPNTLRRWWGGVIERNGRSPFTLSSASSEPPPGPGLEPHYVDRFARNGPRLVVLIVGVDIDAPSPAHGESLMDRFEAGSIGAGFWREHQPYESFLTWANAGRSPFEYLERQPKRLRAFPLSRPYGPRDPWRIVLGLPVASCVLYGPAPLASVSMAEAEATHAEARRLLGDFGVDVEPAFFTLHTEASKRRF